MTLGLSALNVALNYCDLSTRKIERTTAEIEERNQEAQLITRLLTKIEAHRKDETVDFKSEEFSELYDAVYAKLPSAFPEGKTLFTQDEREAIDKHLQGELQINSEDSKWLMSQMQNFQRDQNSILEITQEMLKQFTDHIKAILARMLPR